jgi:hypothetical protein
MLDQLLIEFLEKLIERRPGDVSRIMLEFGESGEVTPESLVTAWNKYGFELSDKLEMIAEEEGIDVPEPELNFLGIGKKKSTTGTTKTGSKLGGLFQSAIPLLGIGASLLRKRPAASAPAPSGGYDYYISTNQPAPVEDPKILGIDKPVFIALCVVAALLLLLVTLRALSNG